MKERIIGALIILTVLIISLVSSSNFFRLIILLCTLGGFYELFHIKYKNKSDKLEIIKWVGFIFIVLFIFNKVYYEINYIVLIIGLLLFYMIPIIFYNDSKKYNINDALYLIGITIFLLISFGSIIYFRNIDINKCIYIFVISFATDVYAFIGGSLIGKHKLTSISPKKTWEGSIIGIVMGSLIGAIYYYNVIGNIDLLIIIICSIILSILSEIGDLVFSSIKRYYNEKDYSHLIPGHGGILDRFDSVLFVTLGMLMIFSLI